MSRRQRQSKCAFLAFATARLDAKTWEAAESGLNPRQRGDLVHAVLHSIWGGEAKGGWRSCDDLRAVLDSSGREGVEAFVKGHVQAAMNSLPVSLRDRMPARYLEIEESRLVKLVTDWLIYESARGRFTVAATEQKTPVVIAGLALDLRLDRRDELEDGSSLIVDYKTSGRLPTAGKPIGRRMSSCRSMRSLAWIRFRAPTQAVWYSPRSKQARLGSPDGCAIR